MFAQSKKVSHVTSLPLMSQPVSLTHSRDDSDQQQSCRMSMAQAVCSTDGVSMGSWMDAHSLCEQKGDDAMAAYNELFRGVSSETKCKKDADCEDGWQCRRPSADSKCGTCYKPPTSCDPSADPDCAVPDYDSCTHQVECRLAGGKGAACGN